ncbi:hypothetical protein VOLCADRAFT_59045, partial [Volvox carteri f. nagariensis]
QPCNPAALQPCNPAQPCNPTTLKPHEPAALQPLPYPAKPQTTTLRTLPTPMPQPSQPSQPQCHNPTLPTCQSLQPSYPQQPSGPPITVRRLLFTAASLPLCPQSQTPQLSLPQILQATPSKYITYPKALTPKAFPLLMHGPQMDREAPFLCDPNAMNLCSFKFHDSRPFGPHLPGWTCLCCGPYLLIHAPLPKPCTFPLNALRMNEIRGLLLS